MTMQIKRLFIANRGEIAVRIIRAAQAMGIATIQAHSEADADMLAVRLADEAICIGPAPAAKSYLDIAAIVEAATRSKADAVHPGYGFLAENAGFVRGVEAAGMRFVGPSADTIDRMGDKVAARQAAEAAGVPVVPGSKGRLDTVEDAVSIAAEIGYPVMIKAAVGGGERVSALPRAKRNCARWRRRRRPRPPRPLAMAGSILSAQSSHHVISKCRSWEMVNAPCTALSANVRCSAAARRSGKRLALHASAKRPAPSCARRRSPWQKRSGMSALSTLEYLYDSVTAEFFFIEMNTRIQVEHPVSEMLTGIDLVQEMIRVSAGEKLSVTQDQITRSGHAIEVRINAEDPLMQFMPWPGQVTALQIPEGDGIRFDHFLYEGYQIPPFYDSLIGKLIVHGKDRHEAIALLKSALQGIRIEGIKTTIPLHLALVDDSQVLADDFHTQWLEPWLAQGNLTAQTQKGEIQ